MSAVKSLQLVAENTGALFAAAKAPVRAASNLVKPRKPLNEIQSDKRVWFTSDMPHCKYNAVAVMIMGDLRYWLEPDENGKQRAKVEHDGHKWVARSLNQWVDKLNIKSRQAVRTAHQILLGEDMVVVNDEYWFNGNQMTHYRLSDKALAMLHSCVTANTPAPKVGVTCVTDNTPCVTGNTPCVTGNTLITGTTTSLTENQIKTYAYANEKTFAEDVPPESPQDGSGKTESQKQDLPLKPIEKISRPHYDELAKTHDMTALLAVCVNAGYLPKGRVMLSDPECSMLERIEYQLHESPLPETLEEFLTVFREGESWESFTGMVMEQRPSVTSPPPRPTLRFLTKHFGTFCEWAAANSDEWGALDSPAVPAVDEAVPMPMSVPVEPAVAPVFEDMIYKHVPDAEEQQAAIRAWAIEQQEKTEAARKAALKAKKPVDVVPKRSSLFEVAH